jgi:phosphoglycolate phosphatase
MVELIIFDWDDVFTLGSTEGYYKCYHEALKSVGVSLTASEEKERIAKKWGSTQEEELAELLQEHPQLIPQAIKAYESHLHGQSFIECLSVTPGSQALLKRLSKKYRLAVATGLHPQLLQTRIMPKFGIPPVFSQIESVYNLEDAKYAKPHPHMLQKIMIKQNILPENTIMVGDASNDVRMARAAGIEPIVVLTGHLNRNEAAELGVKHIIDDVNQLEKVLAEL